MVPELIDERSALMIEKAIIDRFEGDWAVLLVGDREKKLPVPRTRLPRGVREGHWLKVDLDDEGKLVKATVDAEETAKARQRIAEKLERLRKGEHQ